MSATEARGRRAPVAALVLACRTRLVLDVTLYKLLRVVSGTLFEETPISAVVFAVGSPFHDIDAATH